MCGIFNYRHAHVISNNQSVLIFTGRFLAPHVSIYSRCMISERQLRLCNLCIEIQQSDRRRATLSARPAAVDNSGSRGLLAFFSSSPIARSSACLYTRFIFLRRGKIISLLINFLHRYYLFTRVNLSILQQQFDEYFHLVILMSHSKLHTP